MCGHRLNSSFELQLSSAPGELLTTFVPKKYRHLINNRTTFLVSFSEFISFCLKHNYPSKALRSKLLKSIEN